MNEITQKRNLSHKPIFDCKDRWLISFGGAGSGKSYSVAQKILLDRIMQESNHRILVVRKVANTLRVSVFQLFKDLIAQIEEFENFKINKSDMTITYLPNNSQLLFFGLDDIEKLKSIQGITSIWVEEASETEQGDILELNRRLRGETSSYKQIILTFNPISHLHWLKSHFFDNPLSKCSIFRTTYKDNKFIDDEYKQEIEDIANYDIQQYNIYALGEWGVLNQNVVYFNYDYKKHFTDKTIDDFEILHCGVDFNIGGSVCVVCGVVNNVVYVVDGFSSHDTQEMAINLTSRYKNKKLILYPDASGAKETTNASQSDIAILNQNGLTVYSNAANPAIRDRVNAMNRKLSKDELLINQRLEKLNYSLQTQAWATNGKPEKYDNHQGGSIDDWNDALGYLVAYMFPIQNYVRVNGGYR